MQLNKYKKDKQFCLSFFFYVILGAVEVSGANRSGFISNPYSRFSLHIFVKVLNFDKDDFRYNQG